MNKRFCLSWLIIFIVWMLGSFLVHGMLLGSEYAKLSHLFRTPEDSQQYFPLMILAHVLLAGAFVWIYSRGISDAPWLGQGLRFGVAIAMMTVVPTYTIYYVVQPMPGIMVVKQMVFDGVLLILLSLVVARLYHGQKAN